MRPTVVLFILLHCFVEHVVGRIHPKYECYGRPNEKYTNSYHPQCDDYCDRQGKICPRINSNIEGCYCQDGYYRNGEGFCVEHWQCEIQDQLPDPYPAACWPNEVFTKYFNPACESTCENPHKSCSLIIIHETRQDGCECKSGYVRNYLGHCVEPWQCNNFDRPQPLPVPPVPIPQPNSCWYRPHEVLTNNFNPKCEPTCDAPIKRCILIETHKQGCVCKRGYLRNNQGDCVEPWQCNNFDRPQPLPVPPVPIPQPNSCWYRPHEVLTNNFNPKCEPTCDAPIKRCILIETHKQGCVCKRGYLRNNQGDCVEPWQCNNFDRPEPLPVPPVPIPQPNPCWYRPNEVFTKYFNPACESTCENPHKPCPLVLIQKDGCECKSGYVRNHQGDCVEPRQCNNFDRPQPLPVPPVPIPQPNSCWYRPHEVLTNNFNPKCEPTCDAPIKRCILIETHKQGCVCKRGYLRNNQGDCVEPWQCNNFDRPEPLPVPPVPIPQPNPCWYRPNEVFTKYFNPACESTCENPHKPCPLVLIQKEGCECKSGYVRNHQGDCVEPRQCNNFDRPQPLPVPPVPIPQPNPCWYRPHEVLTNNFNPKCEPTCDAPIKRCILIETHKQGCVCKRGYLRNNQGICVERWQCYSNPVPVTADWNLSEERQPYERQLQDAVHSALSAPTQIIKRNKELQVNSNPTVDIQQEKIGDA